MDGNFTLFSIPNPCNANWDEMKIGINSRHCSHCEKQVIDFTRMSPEQITLFLLAHRNEKICGHFRRDQLKMTPPDYELIIRRIEDGHGRSPMGFYLLSLASLLFLSCETGLVQGELQREIPTESLHLETPQDNPASDSSRTNHQTPEEKQPAIPEVMLEGEVAILPVLSGKVAVLSGDSSHKRNTCYTSLEMDLSPSYPGGISSLQQVIRRQFNYPDEIRQRFPKGKMIAEVEITATGQVNRVDIFHNATGSEFLEKELQRLLLSTGPWIPGQIKGEKVTGSVVIPVQFEH